MYPNIKSEEAYGYPSQPPAYPGRAFGSQQHQVGFESPPPYSHPHVSYFAIRSNMNAKFLDATNNNKITMCDYHGGDAQLWY